jgi:hypothetical protein
MPIQTGFASQSVAASGKIPSDAAMDRTTVMEMMGMTAVKNSKN